MGSSTVDCDVAVIGAGPVGLTLALLLNERGHNVHIYDQHAALYPQPRAVTITHQAMRMYGSLGLHQRLFDEGAVYAEHVASMQWVNDDEEVLQEFPFNVKSNSGDFFNYLMHQPSLEKVLEGACLDRGVKIFRSSRFTAVENHDSHVEIIISKMETVVKNEIVDHIEKKGKTFRVTAHFLAGCDGARSDVRESCGIKLIDAGGPRSTWLIVDVTPFDIEEAATWKDANQPRQYISHTRPTTCVPSYAKYRRWEFMLHPHEYESARQAKFVWSLLSKFGATPENSRIDRSAINQLRGGWVDKFTQGRIVLAGDAAHETPPFLGQGLNSGLRDAKSVSWRLSLALQDPAVHWEHLAETFTTEQISIAERLVRQAIQLEKVYTNTLPIPTGPEGGELSALKDRAIAIETLGAPGIHVPNVGRPLTQSNPGTLIIDDLLNVENKEVRLSSLLNVTEWMIVEDGPLTWDNEASSVLNKFQDRLGKRLVIGKDCTNPTGILTGWFKENGLVAVLIRPDYYVYGVAKSASEARDLLGTALAHVYRN